MYKAKLNIVIPARGHDRFGFFEIKKFPSLIVEVNTASYCGTLLAYTHPGRPARRLNKRASKLWTQPLYGPAYLELRETEYYSLPYGGPERDHKSLHDQIVEMIGTAIPWHLFKRHGIHWLQLEVGDAQARAEAKMIGFGM